MTAEIRAACNAVGAIPEKVTEVMKDRLAVHLGEDQIYRVGVLNTEGVPLMSTAGGKYGHLTLEEFLTDEKRLGGHPDCFHQPKKMDQPNEKLDDAATEKALEDLKDNPIARLALGRKMQPNRKQEVTKRAVTSVEADELKNMTPQARLRYARANNIQ